LDDIDDDEDSPAEERTKAKASTSGVRALEGPLVVFVVSCVKYRERWPHLRSTWLRDLNAQRVPYRILIGRAPAGTLREGEDEDVLEVDAADNYEGLPAKMLAAWRALDGRRFEHVFKVDDDCYVNVPRLLEAAEMHAGKHSWGMIIGPEVERDWHFGKCDDETLNRTPYSGGNSYAYYNGGAGYMLSRRTVHTLAKVKRAKFAEELYEDKLLGRILHERGEEALPGIFEMQVHPEAFEMVLKFLGPTAATMVRGYQLKSAELVRTVVSLPHVLVYADCTPAVLLQIHAAYCAA